MVHTQLKVKYKIYVVIALLTISLSGCVTQRDREMQAWQAKWDAERVEKERLKAAKEAEEEKLKKALFARAEKHKLPVIFDNVYTSSPNSAGGVEVTFIIYPLSEIPIKYIKLNMQAYNSVNDLVTSDIDGKKTKALRMVGPMKRDYSIEIFGFENVWYNHTIRCSEITHVEVILMDKSSKTYSGKELDNLFAVSGSNQCSVNY